MNKLSAMTPDKSGMAKAARGEQQPDSFHLTSDAVVRTEPGEENARGVPVAVCPECGCHFSGSLDTAYTVHPAGVQPSDKEQPK